MDKRSYLMKKPKKKPKPRRKRQGLPKAKSKAHHHKPLSLHSLGMERVLGLALKDRESNI